MDTIDLINIRLKKLLEYVKILEGYKGVTAAELVAQAEKRGAVERYLQLACEVVLDVANLLSAEFRFGPVDEGKESVLLLGKEGVLDSEFAKEFAPVAGFRNLLVHDYLKIDYEKVADKVNNRLDDFKKFAKEVAAYL